MKPIIAGVLLFIISIIFAVLIFFLGAQIGLTDLTKQAIVWACLTLVTSLVFCLPIIARSLWLGWSSRYSDLKHLNPGDLQDQDSESARLIGASQRWEHLKQFHRLTGQYKEHRKPWIMVLGDDDEVLEKAFPGIKTNSWIESHNAFWFDAEGVEPAGGWSALRGFGKRPAEGVVYLSNMDKAEHIAEKLQNLFKKINWTLPINRVFVSNDAGGNFSSSLSHILDANIVKVEDIRIGLDNFANQLAALGTISIENSSGNTFAATLSEKFEIVAQDFSEALSADKKVLGKLDMLDRISFVQAPERELLPDLIFKSFDGFRTFGKGRKLKWSKAEKLYGNLSGAVLLLAGVFIYAAYSSYQSMTGLQKGLEQLHAAVVTPTNLTSLVNFQKDIVKLENNQHSFNGRLVRILGYDHSEQLLRSAYVQYGASAKQAVVMPAYNKLQDDLYELNTLSSADLGQVSEENSRFYNSLKAYLMLTGRPDKIESKFLTGKMIEALNQQSLKTSQTQNVVSFFVNHLSKQKSWGLDENADLIADSRQTLANWIGESKAEDRIYHRIIENAKDKYPDTTLAKLLDRDVQGEWIVGRTLPGIYTARAWTEYVKPEFMKAAKNGHVNDWVLASNSKIQPVDEVTINNLKERYFNDYASAWFDVLNSITWVPRTQTLDAVNQLHVYADPQRSPLVALFEVMKANSMLEGKQVIMNPQLANQAAKIANRQISTRGRQVLNTILNTQKDKVETAQEQVNQYLEGPLQSKFGTLLQLVDTNVNPKSDLSLQRYLEKITSTKQRLIQIAGASDAGAAARMAVQGVMAGENNEFTDGLQYARVIEASIGDRLLPFARNVFVLPFYTSWNTITGSAQRNINNMWNQTLLMPLKADLGGRYPFSSTETEVSLPMMAKYLDPSQGLVDQFIQNQLSGVLTKQGSQWVETPGQDLKVNRDFVNQINKLNSVANDLFVNGQDGYTFELKPASTPGITQFNLSLDGQSLDYFNQEADWKSFKWPGDMSKAGMRITWETDEAGLRQTQEFSGRLGFIRMLEKARITPVDRGTYLVESPIVQGRSIRFYMRTNSGKGPLGLLDLRNIHIPAQVFEVGK